jgi:hypothetical protein
MPCRNNWLLRFPRAIIDEQACIAEIVVEALDFV